MPGDRVRKYGYPFYGGAENISYGKSNAFETLLNHIIDDGIASRGHRNNIINDNHRCGGVFYCEHPSAISTTVFTYAFYVSSPDEGDVLKKTLNEWRETDKEDAKTKGWNGKGEVFSRISFEYPNLIKELKFGDNEVGIIKRDMEKELYPLEF